MEREFMPATEFARMWRNQPTPAEQALWRELRGSRTGYKFSRQVRIGDYFADLCCRQYRLVIEVDGGVHERCPEQDEARDAAMRSRGYEVLRLPNDEVMNHMDRALSTILCALETRPRVRY